jgi:hypothetical protein
MSEPGLPQYRPQQYHPGPPVDGARLPQQFTTPLPTYPPAVPGQLPAFIPMAVPVAAPSSGISTAAMVLGIVGLVSSWFLLGLPSVLAVIFGHIGVAATKDGTRSGRGQAVAGLVLGYVVIVPAVFVTLLIAGVIGAAATGTAVQ